MFLSVLRLSAATPKEASVVCVCDTVPDGGRGQLERAVKSEIFRTSKPEAPSAWKCISVELRVVTWRRKCTKGIERDRPGGD